MMVARCSATSQDSFEEVFQVATIVVPICPHKRAHRLDSENPRFQQIISRAVHSALAQYVWEMNALDRICQGGIPAEPENPMGDIPDPEAAVRPQQAAAHSAQPLQASSSEEITSSIVWAPAMEPLAPADLPLSPNSPPIFANDSFKRD